VTDSIGPLLSTGFGRNVRIVHAQAEGVGHEESLTQTEYNVNCLNWVVGHIVSSRSQLLVQMFGADPVMSEEQTERYRRESDPVTEDGPDVIQFSELLAMLDNSQAAIEAELDKADDDFLYEETPVGEDRTASRARQLMFTLFHDTYHTGQTDLLRQLSGKSDKII
jgi:uncharacterized damage-inducible protein DinB